MADIKTRDVVKGTIKKINKAAIAADRMRSAYVQTKERAEHATHPDVHNAEEYASDRVEGGADRITHEAAHQFDKQGRKGLEETKRNVSKAKDGIQRFREKRAAESMKRQTVRTSGNKTIKAVEQTEKTIKQSAGSAGKKTIKTAGKGAAKAAQRSVKTTKTAIKTTQQAAKTAQKTAQATVKASQKAAQAAKATAKAAVAGVKAAVKATIAAVKAIIAATKALVAAIAAGGWVAVAVIVVICLIALICGSVFGIFFSGEDSGTGMSMQTAVQEINADYDAKMEAEKNSVAYDNMEISGGRAVWKDVLAVYAVKTNTDKDNPQEVATMDESKKQILSDIFWEMNSISSRSESHSETEITETDDGNGNIVQTETTVTKTTLYITVSHLTVDEMADLYGFDAGQREYLAELLKDENNSLWAAVLYGIRYSEDQIVTVALSQVGNVGGEPYWSWYYNHRDEKGCYFSINTPKTKAGEREIPMTEGVKQAFLMEREFQSQAEISSKSRVDGYDDFIFVNRYGDVQNQGNLNKALRRMMRDCNDEILEKYGADSDPVLLPQFSCHILRHTFATRLCESGANLKFIQSILGHADVSTTMNIYVDVTDALKKKEITAFDDYMTTKLET
ncbi:MAG: tyrosine-type recombinase/integrase [Oscillospiraceae bacterium]